MAIQIRISPDELMAIAARQQEILDKLDSVMSVLISAERLLEDSWEGSSAVMLIRSVDSAQRGIRQIGETAAASKERLEAIIHAFETIDSGEQASFIQAVFTGLAPRDLILPGLQFGAPGRVRIMPDGVKDAAKRCESATELLEECATAYDGCLNDLGNYWEGRAYRKYVADYEEISIALREVRDGLNEVADKLMYFATRYEEIDNMF